MMSEPGEGEQPWWYLCPVWYGSDISGPNWSVIVDSAHRHPIGFQRRWPQIWPAPAPAEAPQ